MTVSTALGLDFGTTNTVGALVAPGGALTPLSIQSDSGLSEVFRTVLCYWREMVGGISLPKVEAGPFAVAKFLEERESCRFLQSIKTLAASAAFEETRINGRAQRFEDLMGTFFRLYAGHASGAMPELPKRLVLGRPVVFAGSNPNAELAMTRYRQALEPFGFDDVLSVYEPVAAAYFFAQRLEGSATVFVGDFGGGTSDFSIIRFEKSGNRLSARPLGRSGVPVAGDSFDARIIDAVVAPFLGKGSSYQSFGKTLEIPRHYYGDLANWSRLALMRSDKTLRELGKLAFLSKDPEPLKRLIAFIEQEQAYPLYRSIAEAKMTLSVENTATLGFDAGDRHVERVITRVDFEGWIAGDLARIGSGIDEALQDAGLGPEAIDRVFLTGGTSYVPAVRKLFQSRFSAERTETGDQLVSIAYGLALIGAEEDPTPWLAAA